MPDTKNLTPTAAFDMESYAAQELVESLDYFCDQIDEAFSYFKKNGKINPAEKSYQMLASMLIMALDKLQSEGLFRDMPWREVYAHWVDEGETFPDDFVDEAEQ